MKRMFFYLCMVGSCLFCFFNQSYACDKHSVPVVTVYHIYGSQPNIKDRVWGHVAHKACYNSSQNKLTSWQNFADVYALMCGCLKESEQKVTIQNKFGINKEELIIYPQQGITTPEGNRLTAKQMTIYSY